MRKGNIANVKIEENKQKTVNVSQFEILLALEREIVEEKRSVDLMGLEGKSHQLFFTVPMNGRDPLP